MKINVDMGNPPRSAVNIFPHIVLFAMEVKKHLPETVSLVADCELLGAGWYWKEALRVKLTIVRRVVVPKSSSLDYIFIHKDGVTVPGIVTVSLDSFENIAHDLAEMLIRGL